MLADKGYDSDAIRQDLRDRGAAAEIPSTRHRKVQYSVSKRLYALRSRIECHLQEQLRIATRYDKPQRASSASCCSAGFAAGSWVSLGSQLTTRCPRPLHGEPDNQVKGRRRHLGHAHKLQGYAEQGVHLHGAPELHILQDALLVGRYREAGQTSFRGRLDRSPACAIADPSCATAAAAAAATTRHQIYPRPCQAGP